MSPHNTRSSKKNKTIGVKPNLVKEIQDATVSKKKRIEKLNQPPPEVPVPNNETEEMVYAHDQQKFINQAVAQLSPQKKLIYELNQVQGKSYDEIAKTLNLSPHTVKSHLLKAIKFIRSCLKDRALLLIALLTTLGYLKFF